MTTNPSELFSPFLGNTLNVPEEEDRLRTYLNEQFSLYKDVINAKKIGTVTPSENFNGETWSYIKPGESRNGFCAILYLPSLVSGTYPLPISDVDPNFVVTTVIGSASKPCSAVGAGDGDYFSFMTQGNANVTFTMSDKVLVITSSLVGYSGFIKIDYLRAGTAI